MTFIKHLSPLRQRRSAITRPRSGSRTSVRLPPIPEGSKTMDINPSHTAAPVSIRLIHLLARVHKRCGSSLENRSCLSLFYIRFGGRDGGIMLGRRASSKSTNSKLKLRSFTQADRCCPSVFRLMQLHATHSLPG